MNAMTLADRFWAKVEKTDACWLWTACTNGAGYGTFNSNGRMWLAHRFAYTLAVGPIPAGLHLDHLCRVTLCVRPTHLEPVTARENLLRGNTVTARNASRTECPQGHRYSPENTYNYATGRICRACSFDRMRLRREAARA